MYIYIYIYIYIYWSDVKLGGFGFQVEVPHPEEVRYNESLSVDDNIYAPI